MMRSLGFSVLCMLVVMTTEGQTPSAIKTGPAVGARIPPFSAPDQRGVMQTSSSILGPKGALLVFFRSADW